MNIMTKTVNFNDNYSRNIISILYEAKEYVKNNNMSFISFDIVSLFLLKTDYVKNIFQQSNNGEHLDEIIQMLNDAILLNLEGEKEGEKEDKELQFYSAQNVFDWFVAAKELSIINNDEKVDIEHFLLTLLKINDGDICVVKLLENPRIERDKIVETIKESKKNNKGVNLLNGDSMIDKYMVNINDEVKDVGEKLVGRDVEMKRMLNILSNKNVNNVMIKGIAGVGKTSIVKEFARKINVGDVPEMFKNTRILALDVQAIISGTKYRGEFEDRMRGLLYEIKESKDLIVFLDDIHEIFMAERTSGGAYNFSSFLKFALSNGEIKMISTTSNKSYEDMKGAGSFMRNFNLIDLKEISDSGDIATIIENFKVKYETHHDVKIAGDGMDVLMRIMHLDSIGSNRDKNTSSLLNMIKYIDSVASYASTQLNLKVVDKVVVNEYFKLFHRDIFDNLVSVVESGRVDIKPADNFSDKLRVIFSLKENLKAQVFEQEQAIDKIVDTITVDAMGLKLKNKPVMSALLAGPTGVGKTEVAKQLSKQLGLPFIRYDMSEYSQKHEVAKLIGSPAGYVGSDKGGRLVEDIIKNPKCVLLLDEIEKANPDIFNIFLQIMDYATLTDSLNQKANFKDVIILMTTNLGANVYGKKMGFTGADSEVEDDMNKERLEIIRKALKPEFYNRFDHVINFNRLTSVGIKQIVTKHIKLLEDSCKFSDKVPVDLSISYTPSVIEFIAKQSFDSLLGARPIEHYVEQNIANAISLKVIQKCYEVSLADKNFKDIDDFKKLKMKAEIKIVKKELSISIS